MEGLKWLGGRMFEGVANKMAVRFFEGGGEWTPLLATPLINLSINNCAVIIDAFWPMGEGMNSCHRRNDWRGKYRCRLRKGFGEVQVEEELFAGPFTIGDFDFVDVHAVGRPGRRCCQWFLMVSPLGLLKWMSAAMLSCSAYAIEITRIGKG